MNDQSAFPPSWLNLLQEHSSLGDSARILISDIEQRIAEREATGVTVYPIPASRYRALELLTPESVVAVCLGQDPYHGTVKTADGRIVPQATGLSFSVPRGAKIPPSLLNIGKEMSADLGCPTPANGDLTHWADSGVLMLNAILSVEAGQPKSHDRLGWQTITGAILEALSKAYPGLVFILWGNAARSLKGHLADNEHTVIESSHPSPIGGSCFKGFFGSKPFSRANAALIARGKTPINWSSAITKGSSAPLF